MMNDIIEYSYICDGKQTVFEYLFETFSVSFVKIYLDGELIEKGFTVYPFNDKCGGKVVFEYPPLAGKKLTVLRELNFSRVCDFQTGGVFRAEDLNYEMNYNIACLNQLDKILKKSIKLSRFDNKEVNPVLPPAKAGHAIVWNEKGNGFSNLDINITEQVNFVEDCLNSVENLYNDLTEIITNSLDVGILGLFHNLLGLIRGYHPDAFEDFKLISSDSDKIFDYGLVSDTQNINVKNNGKL